MADEEKVIDRGDELTPKVESLTPEAATEVAAKSEATDAAKVDALVEGDLDAAKALEEGEETPEEKAERERAEEEARKKANIRIPKFRVDEIQEKARKREEALTAELNAVKAQLTAATTPTVDELATLKTEIETLTDEYEAHMIEGKAAEAKLLRTKIDAMRDDLMERKIAARAASVQQETIGRLTYDAALANLEATYPQLNPDGADFDEALAQEMGNLMSVYIKAGSTPLEALRDAAKYVLPKAAPAPAPTAATTSAADLKAKREQEARTKAAKANEQQPPQIAGVGKDADKAGAKGDAAKVDVMRMSAEKFAKVDAELRSKLRGDELE